MDCNSCTGLKHLGSRSALRGACVGGFGRVGLMRGVKGYSNTNKWVDKFKVGKGNPYRAPMKGAIRSLRVFTVFEMEGKPNQVGKKSSNKK